MPYPLQIGLDWLAFHTPPFDGGLSDQPMLLLRNIRTALNTYNTITAYNKAQHQLGAEGLSKFYAANQQIVKFMEYVWSLQEESADDGE